jgi:NAD(P)H-dependent FMN reductase
MMSTGTRDSQGHVLLLVGSAKRPQSTSESLGMYLCDRLHERGFETDALLLHRALKTDEGREELLAASDAADILVVACPLYADSLPYLAVKAMELMAQHRKNGQAGTEVERADKQRLLALVNSGFPEAHQNDTALAICRQFAREAGFDWAGGLALGGGQAVHGQPLSEVEGMARHAVQALNLAAAALAEGRPVPHEAVEAMAKPIIPTWAYTWMSKIGWRWQARKNGARNLNHRPY